MAQLGNIYGSHLPFRLVLERNLVVNPKNEVFPSQNLGLEILTGRDISLRYPVFKNEPVSFSQEIKRISFN